MTRALMATAIILAGCLLALSATGALARECGVASYYAHAHHGRTQANGKPFNMYAMTAAHKSLAFGTKVRVRRQDGKGSITVTITDRGPYVRGRIIDLSLAAAKKLGTVQAGVAKVCIERVR